MNNIVIGNRIRTVRERKHLTQERLAELAGISTTALSNIESGRACPYFKNIVALTKVLDISIDYLIAEEQRELNKVYINEINVLLGDMDEKKLIHLNKYIRLLNEMEQDEIGLAL